MWTESDSSRLASSHSTYLLMSPFCTYASRPLLSFVWKRLHFLSVKLCIILINLIFVVSSTLSASFTLARLPPIPPLRSSILLSSIAPSIASLSPPCFASTTRRPQLLKPSKGVLSTSFKSLAPSRRPVSRPSDWKTTLFREDLTYPLLQAWHLILESQHTNPTAYLHYTTNASLQQKVAANVLGKIQTP